MFKDISSYKDTTPWWKWVWIRLFGTKVYGWDDHTYVILYAYKGKSYIWKIDHID